MQPVDYVDPLIDTADRRFFFLTTASRPFGMVNLSPDTRISEEGDWFKAGYRYDDEYVYSFSHIHAWQLCGIPILPTTGTFIGHKGPESYRSRFSHKKENAQAGYHQVYLEDHEINAELTATTRVGFHRYTFDNSDDAWVLFDLGAPIMYRMDDCSAEWNDEGCVWGYIDNPATRRRPKSTRIYFCAEFDHPIRKAQTWKDGKETETQSIKGTNTGVGFNFSIEAGDRLQLKVAISYCSLEQAKLNLRTELPHWDFDLIHREAKDEWNEMLSRIVVEGGTKDQRIKFYTDLFHALKGRRRVSDVDGKYLDMTGEKSQVRQIPLNDEGLPLYEHHNSDAFWGAAWAINVLWGLAYPEILNNFCNTFLDYYRNGGLIPRGPAGGNYTFVMTAPTSTTLFVSAWMRGMRTFDKELAWDGLLKNHGPNGLMAKAGYEHDTFLDGGAEHYIKHGYVHHGPKGGRSFHSGSTATMTLEYAFHDWALAQLAKTLGKDIEHAELMKRSDNFMKIWDADTLYMRPKDQNGSFVGDDFKPTTAMGYEEGNAQQYRWHVPHNIPALIELFGGKEVFIEELDKLFKQARETGFINQRHGHHNNHDYPMDYGNQPSTFLAHLFSHAGAPWLTQKWVREVIDVAKSDITPYGGYGGDEDQGMMGSLNALMSIGLFSITSMCEENPSYELTTPLFDKISIKQPNGNTFTIEAKHSSVKDLYIHSASLNGATLEGFRIPQKAILKGGSLKLELKEEPNKEWGVSN